MNENETYFTIIIANPSPKISRYCPKCVFFLTKFEFQTPPTFSTSPFNLIFLVKYLKITLSRVGKISHFLKDFKRKKNKYFHFRLFFKFTLFLFPKIRLPPWLKKNSSFLSSKTQRCTRIIFVIPGIIKNSKLSLKIIF